jgi:hypothetical protein
MIASDSSPKVRLTENFSCGDADRHANRRLPSSLLDDEALHGAPEITVPVRKARHREAGAVRTDPRFRIEQDPLADRLPRKADGEVGIDEGPLQEIRAAWKYPTARPRSGW